MDSVTSDELPKAYIVQYGEIFSAPNYTRKNPAYVILWSENTPPTNEIIKWVSGIGITTEHDTGASFANGIYHKYYNAETEHCFRLAEITAENVQNAANEWERMKQNK